MLSRHILVSMFVVTVLGACQKDKLASYPKLCVKDSNAKLGIQLDTGEITSYGIDMEIAGFHKSEYYFGFMLPFPMVLPATSPNDGDKWVSNGVEFVNNKNKGLDTISSGYSEFGFDQNRVRSLITLRNGKIVENILVQEENLSTGQPTELYESCGRKKLTVLEIENFVQRQIDLGKTQVK